MNIFKNKPAVVLFITGCFSIVIASYIKISSTAFYLICAAIVIILLFSALFVKKSFTDLSVVFGFALIFFINFHVNVSFKPENDVSKIKQKISGFSGIVGKSIIQKRTYKNKTLHQEFALHVKYAYCKSVKYRVTGKVLVKNKFLLFNLKPGSKVRVKGWITRVNKMKPMKNFNYGRFLWLQGYSHFVWVTRNNAEILMPPEKNISNWIYKAKRSIIFTLYKNLSYNKNAHDFISALLLGERDKLNGKIVRDFRKSGVFHVLALSGLHMAMIFALIFGILGFFNVKRNTSFILTGCLLVVFTLTAGFKYSLIRALLMALFIIIIKVSERDTDYINSLFLAGFIIILFDPSGIFSISFQLSFLATLGILLFFEPISNGLKQLIKTDKRGISFITASFAVTLSAQILIIPLLLYYFGVFYFISFLANLIIVPVVTFIAFISMAGFITFFIPIISISFFSLSEFLINALFWMVKGFSFFSFLSLRIKPGIVFIIFYYVLFIIILIGYKARYKVINFIKNIPN